MYDYYDTIYVVAGPVSHKQCEEQKYSKKQKKTTGEKDI